jgi:hypothetical protein
MDEAGKVGSAAQVRLWIVLAGMFAIGAASSVWGDQLPWRWLQHIARDLSTAFVTAALLGLTVDRILKIEIARDVFYAAFRYVLPDELKDEVHRIINYKFLCIEHAMIINVVPLTDRLVRVDISVERTLKNISRHPELASSQIVLDEWDYSVHRSTIDQCVLLIGTERKNSIPDPDHAQRVDAICNKTESIEIKPGHTFKTISKGSEIHRRNGVLFRSFPNPTINPVVTVQAPAGFNNSCTFGVPGEKIIASEISKQWKLDGTQFPGQYTRVRWWPEGSSER